MSIFELNNIRRDADFDNSKIRKGSPVVEVFNALVNGESLERFGKTADKAVAYIKGLGERAENSDPVAISELNTIRRFVIEAPVMEEIRMLSIFGTYQNVGFDESIEREVYKHAGERSRVQAANGDVVFPHLVRDTYPVPTFTVSGGYAVDYRRVALGDMSKENEGLAQVRIDILNRAKAEIIDRVYKAIKAATGVKYLAEMAGLTKAGVDDVLNKVRRFGKPTVVGDYAMISQFSQWAGYVGTISNNTITGISQKAMDEIQQAGALSMYNGAVLSEMDNPYDETKLNAAGDNFDTLLPQGLAFVLPAGARSPIATWTKGGLTSCTGVDVKSGHNLARFDIEVACDVAKGREHEIGVLRDTNLSPL